MGLIERAIGGGGPGELISAPAPITNFEGEPFDLDRARLKMKGVFIGGEAPTTQAYELRAIKRRLMRRIGFLQRAGRDPRLARSSGRNRNLILMTSTRPGEGKSFAATNLALSFATEEGIPVCLIDGDPARPRLRTYFEFPEGPGLSDLLRDPSLSISAVSRTARGASLTFIGEGSRIPNATDLFGSLDAKRFFAGLSAGNPDGLIIIDAPPMLATTETISLARHADEVVFVVEADSTPQPAIAAALDELLELNQNVSLLLNRCLVPAGGAHYSAYEYYDRRPTERGGAGAPAAAGDENNRG